MSNFIIQKIPQKWKVINILATIITDSWDCWLISKLISSFWKWTHISQYFRAYISKSFLQLDAMWPNKTCQQKWYVLLLSLIHKNFLNVILLNFSPFLLAGVELISRQLWETSKKLVDQKDKRRQNHCLETENTSNTRTELLNVNKKQKNVKPQRFVFFFFEFYFCNITHCSWV